MKREAADNIQAMATRAMLTCRCSHQQTDHLHSLKTGAVVGTWGWCMTDGCRCQAFQSCLSAGEKRDMDTGAAGVPRGKNAGSAGFGSQPNSNMSAAATGPKGGLGQENGNVIGKSQPRKKGNVYNQPNAGKGGVVKANKNGSAVTVRKI